MHTNIHYIKIVFHTFQTTEKKRKPFNLPQRLQHQNLWGPSMVKERFFVPLTFSEMTPPPVAHKTREDHQWVGGSCYEDLYLENQTLYPEIQ